MSFDTEVFINEVEIRPVVWDSRCSEYSNRIEKRKAWEELCEKFIPDFSSKTTVEKNNAALQLQKKWKSIRDSYTRELSKQRRSKSGSGCDGRKQYIFFKQLSFLSPICETKPSIENPTEIEGDVEQVISSEAGSSCAPKGKKRKYSEEEKLFQALARSVENKTNKIPEGDDADKHFLLSLLPDLKAIPEHQKLDAKFELMGVLKKYKIHNLPPPANQNPNFFGYRSNVHDSTSFVPVPSTSFVPVQSTSGNLRRSETSFLQYDYSTDKETITAISSPQSVESHDSNTSLYADLFQDSL